jgi:hypothetical protein
MVGSPSTHSPEWIALCTCITGASAPSALAGFTDGTERLLLNFKSRRPVAGFFLPAFEEFRKSPETFGAQLEAYLESAEVCERTDDDKSIAIILNRAAEF